MKFLKINFIILAFALFIFACSQANKSNNTANNAVNNTNSVANTNTQTPASPSDDLASAKIVYNEKCAKCHKEDGTGGEIDILGEKRKAANLAGERMKKDSDKDLTEAIADGIQDEGMPAFKGKLTDDQIKDLVKFIRKEFQGK